MCVCVHFHGCVVVAVVEFYATKYVYAVHGIAMQCDAYKQRANKKDKRTFVTSENKTGNSAKNSKLFIDCAGIANNYGENVAILLDIFALSLTFNSHLLQ